MTSDPMQAFFTLHRDLSREGPGEAEDILWAAACAKTPRNAQVVDAGCGPGGDIATLLQVAPEGHVTALDKTAQFVDVARAAWAEDDRVTVLKADMTRIINEYDLIWSAGAVYFIGVTEALTAWRRSLRKGGAIAFSEICWFTDSPSDRPKRFWSEGYPNMRTEAGVAAQIEAAGFEIIGQRRLSDAAWEAYFGPLDTRIAQLRPGADAALHAVLDEAEEEAACWRAHRDEFGYLLSVVQPK